MGQVDFSKTEICRLGTPKFVFGTNMRTASAHTSFTGKIVWILTGFIRGFLLGLVLKSSLMLIRVALKPHKLTKSSFWKNEPKDMLRFAAFVSMLAGGTRLVEKLLAQVRGKEVRLLLLLQRFRTT